MQSTITIKGQATIPKEVRDHLGVKPGDRVKFFFNARGEVILLPMKPVSEVSGMLGRPGQRAVSVEDMNAAITEHAAEANARAKSSMSRRPAKRSRRHAT